MAQIAPPNYSNARWFMIAAGLGILFLVLWNIRNILVLGLMAIILEIFITIPVGYLARYGVKRLPAIILTIAGMFGIVALVVMLVLPILINQFEELSNTIIRGVERIANAWNTGEIQEQFPFLRDLELAEDFRLSSEQVQDIARQGIDALSQLGGQVLPIFGGIANTFLSALIVIFLTVFFLADPNRYKEGFIQLVPIWYRPRARHILTRINTLLRRWIFGQMIGMTITGIGTFIGLSLVGIQQAAALAVLTAIFSFVPNFGELIAVLTALSVGVVQAPDRLIWIIVVIYGVSFLQGQIFGPLIASETVNIPPVLILLGQIVVGGFFGVAGIVLAVPIMAIGMVLVQEVYVRDILGDTSIGDSPIAAVDDAALLVVSRDDGLVTDGV